jgi:antibiotic biosynthesis monooxygenase (ABM) superfamily enzyme
MSDQESVTAVVTRRVLPGRKTEYTAWVDQVEKIARQFPGHQGVTNKIRGEHGECHIVFRFDTVEHLSDWEESEERKEWVAKLEGLVEGEERIERLTGLEFLFANQVHPKAHKMVLVLTVVIFTMLLILRPFVSFLFSTVPATPDWLVLLFGITLQVLLMVYLVMPRLTRYLAHWLIR